MTRREGAKLRKETEKRRGVSGTEDHANRDDEKFVQYERVRRCDVRVVAEATESRYQVIFIDDDVVGGVVEAEVVDSLPEAVKRRLVVNLWHRDWVSSTDVGVQSA